MWSSARSGSCWVHTRSCGGCQNWRSNESSIKSGVGLSNNVKFNFVLEFEAQLLISVASRVWMSMLVNLQRVLESEVQLRSSTASGGL